ncbi:MAG: energy-coupling factor transporter ATPase [Firmicutes bacterium]|nr:energy-coupling factor transporter ATPase [Bacillota bacterium]
MNGRGIELINVSKDFAGDDGKITALADISLSIGPGEYIGILGLNGSGKSTLARILNGLVKPNTGKVYVNGIDLDSPGRLTEVRQIVGMVFQNPDNQLVCPVVAEEVSFGPENLGLPSSEVDSRVDWSLRLVGLEDKKHHAPHLLSGGQKQKVALASVLAMRPDYLILDEPTSMLDPSSRWDVLEYLRKVNAENGITIVLISHNPEDLIHASRLIVLDRGSIYLQGSPREVYSEVDKLAAIGLEPPGIYNLINRLEREGYRIDGAIETIPQLVESLCRI